MRILYVFLVFGLIVVAASTFKNKSLNPVIDEPQMPGTTTPIEGINTAPSPTPAEHESETFRGSTLKKMEQEQKQKKKKQKKKDGEKKRAQTGP